MANDNQLISQTAMKRAGTSPGLRCMSTQYQLASRSQAAVGMRWAQ